MEWDEDLNRSTVAGIGQPNFAHYSAHNPKTMLFKANTLWGSPKPDHFP